MKLKELFEKMEGSPYPSTDNFWKGLENKPVPCYALTPMGFMAVFPDQDGIMVGAIVKNDWRGKSISYTVKSSEQVMAAIDKEMKKNYQNYRQFSEDSLEKTREKSEARVEAVCILGRRDWNTKYYFLRYKNGSLKIKEQRPYGEPRTIMRGTFWVEYNSFLRGMVNILKDLPENLKREVKGEAVAKQL